MTNIMDDYENDCEILMLVRPFATFGDKPEFRSEWVIDCMSTWPLISRNKVDDSKVSEPVQRCMESDNLVLKKAAEEVCAVCSSI